MIKTPDLIAALAAQPKPVRRLGPPLLRSLGWLSVAGLVLTVLAVSHKLRPDFGLHMQDSAFQLRLFASAATGVLAVFAAFVLSIPGRSRLWLLLPVPAALVWITNIGYQCLTNWVAIGPNGMSAGETADCFATLVIISLPLGLTAHLTLRHARHFATSGVAFMASLAISGVTAFAMTMFHALDASVLILAFNLVTTAAFLGAGLAFGAAVRR
ncbi:MAG: NrsF family protein [Cypionkella sp.]